MDEIEETIQYSNNEVMVQIHCIDLTMGYLGTLIRTPLACSNLAYITRSILFAQRIS